MTVLRRYIRDGSLFRGNAAGKVGLLFLVLSKRITSNMITKHRLLRKVVNRPLSEVTPLSKVDLLQSSERRNYYGQRRVDSKRKSRPATDTIG